MATVCIDVPDALVTDLSRAIAQRMNVVEPTTGAARLALAQAFIKDAAKQALLDYRAQQAAATFRANTSDPANAW